MTDLLIFADTIRSPEMRHEIPLAVPDPFLYAEKDGRRIAVVGGLEVPRLAGLGGLEVRATEAFGRDELQRRGMPYEEVGIEVAVRACHELGLREAAVPWSFPLVLADRLREEQVAVRVDRELFATRRRRKTDGEIAGVRRAQQAAAAGMAAAAGLLAHARVDGERVLLDGEPLTCERLKAAIGEAFNAHDAAAEEMIVACGPQSAVGHDMGSGPIGAGQPVVIDIWPRDRESGCYADMTRTFVVGEAPAELRGFHEVAFASLQASLAAIRAGIDGHDVFRIACEPYRERGYPTLLSKREGEVLSDGFFHGLGHGVGLEVHEAPFMGMTPSPLAAGDVVTVEPGCYRQGLGGVRLEDLVLVTEDGCENLTDFPYELAPA
jgi:Xaa-Pro aminopeptidase